MIATPTNAPTACTSRGFVWLARLLVAVVGVGVFIAVLDRAMTRAAPDVANPLVFDLTWPQPVKGSKEPLVSTGRVGAADFLVLEFLGENKVRIVYDHWGSGGPASPPFEVEAGRRERLEINLPSLATLRPQKDGLGQVRVAGQVRFEGRLRSHGREPHQVYFGENPIGGTSAGPRFSGGLALPNGRVLRGGPESYFGRPQLAVALVRSSPWQVAMALLAGGLAGGLVWGVLRLVRRVNWSPFLRRRWRVRTRAPHRTFLIMLLICGWVFSWHVTQGGLRFIYPDSFGSFYDQQAASLLQGRLDVPESAISGEAFVVKGKFYGYYGVTPALLRIPLVTFDALVGQVTRVYLLGYYLLALAAAYGLLCHGTRLVAGKGAWPSSWAVVLLLGATGLGSTFLFLGSRAYVYHEAILAGAAFALLTTLSVLRWLETGRRKWAAWALVAGLLALHARPTPGLFALGLLGAASCWRLWLGRGSGGWREPLWWAVGAGCGLMTFSGLSYLKFGTFDGSPFRYAVQYTPERRARFEDRNFHLSNLRHNTDVYLFSADLAVSQRFPYFRFGGAGPGGTYPGMRIDLEEPAVSLPVAMPALFLLATAVGLWAVLAVPGLRVPLALLAVAMAPMALALCTAIVTSHRYTGDFCPWLIAGAALALAAIDAEASRWRGVVLSLAAALVLWGMAVNSGLAFQFRGEMVWGLSDSDRQRYGELRDRVDRFFGIKSP